VVQLPYEISTFMANSPDNQKRKEFAQYYASLSPEERRDRILLEPAFRDLYNEITAAHRVVQVPAYFWQKWVPILGPLAATLYQKLRQYCYYNPQTGEKRHWCWPKQATLCREIGVSSRNTLLKGLRVLEDYGFIHRVKTYYRDPNTGRPHQGTDKYYVYFEIPLIDSDAAELLIRASANARPSDIHTSAFVLKKRAHGAAQKTGNQRSTRSSTNNVNVDKTTNVPLNDDAYKEAEYLADLLADEFGDKRSHGFYRRVSRALAPAIIYRMLSETKDAHNRGLIKTTKGRYFTDLAKRHAKDEGVDLNRKTPPNKET
jgi:hypothetical protein